VPEETFTMTADHLARTCAGVAARAVRRDRERISNAIALHFATLGVPLDAGDYALSVRLTEVLALVEDGEAAPPQPAEVPVRRGERLPGDPPTDGLAPSAGEVLGDEEHDDLLMEQLAARRLG
jgi:hypothetical protein